MYNSDTIRQARQTNIAAYLTRKGEQLKRVGTSFCLAAHDSLQIKDNMFNWFSQGKSGNAIDFVMAYYGLDFKTAVEELTGEVSAVSAPAPIPRKHIEQPKDVVMPEKADNERRIIAYLCKKRALDYSLVCKMIDRGEIFQDVRGNCVFVIRDFISRQIIGYELTGTTDKRFKRISAHRGFGFNVGFTENAEHIYLFESAIDLLSYYQLNRPLGLLVSMGGVNKSVSDNIAGIFPQADFICCTDNDKAGNDFFDELRKNYGERVTRQAAPNGKDWNEFLNLRSV